MSGHTEGQATGRDGVGVDVLALADFAGMNESAVKAKIAEDFGVGPEQLDGCEIIVAYMSVGDWGCDSGAFIVFRKDGAIYEVNGSHCSCHGFSEGSYSGGGTQWEPELVPDVAAIIQRDDWALACGGYDRDEAGNATAIRAALAPFQTGGAE